MKFNVQQYCATAWELCWKDNLKQRASKHAFRVSTTFYLTASDIENQVRTFLEEEHYGKPRGTMGRAMGRPWRNGTRISGDLQGDVRKWLLGQVNAGVLACHNFGRGHVSGMRFRPAGEPISRAEEETMVNKEKRRHKPALYHYNPKGWNGRPECTKARRSGFSRPNHRIRVTSKKEDVTCPRCKKLAEAMVCEELPDHGDWAEANAN